MVEVTTSTHWTERSTEDFLYRISADFIAQVEEVMEQEDINQSALAQALGVTEGRVSQVLNDPGNLTLKKIAEYARAIRRKIAVVCYDDGDRANRNGPIHPSVFKTCWELAGRPKDFFPLQSSRVATTENRVVSAFGTNEALLTSPVNYYPDMESNNARINPNRLHP